MVEFIFMVICSQPWMLVAIGCLLLSAFITLFWGRDYRSPHVLYLFPNNEEEKWPHWVCGILLSAVFVIWVALTIVNHTTVGNDILSFVTVTLFSVMLIYVAQIFYILLMVVFVSLVVGIWWLFHNYILKD